MKAWYICGMIIHCILASFAAPCHAHPHVFVDCGFTILFDEHGIVGLQQRWLLDEMFTAFLLEDFDANANEKFEPEEVAALKAGAFDNLLDSQYFTHILVDGEAQPIPEAASFAVEFADDGRAIYDFFLPCPISIGATSRQALIAIFDETYYCDVTLVKKAIITKNHDAFTLAPQIKELPEFTYYYDQMIPQGLLLTISKKP